MANPFEQFAAPAASGNPFEQFAASAANAAPQEQISGVEASLRGLGQGVSMNWLDEGIGYGGNLYKLLTEGKEGYLKAAEADTKAQRDKNKLAREQHPGKFLASEIVGGIAPTIGAALIPGGQAAAAANGAKLTAQAATMAGRVGQSAKVGAAYGGLYGAGAAEMAPGATLPEQVQNTAVEGVKGAAMGGIIGAAMPPVIDVAKAVASPITNLVRAKTNPSGMAADKVAEAFRRDSPNVANPLDKAAERPGLYRDPDAILADLGGENVRLKLRSAVDVPNDQRTVVQKVLDDRQKTQHAKIETGMVDAVGDPKKYYQTEDAIVKVQKAQADPAFRKAFDAEFNPDVPAFKSLFGRPTFNAIKDRVERSYLDEGVAGVAGNARTTPLNNVRPLEVVHRIKVELDKQINQAELAAKMGNAGGKEAFDLKTLMTLKNDLRAALDSSSGAGIPLYQKALKDFGDSASLSRALDLGFEHAKTKEAPEIVKATLAKMSPPEKELYRMGQARQFAEVNRGGKKTADRVARDWDSPQRELVMDEIAKTPEARQQFQQTLDALAEQTKTRASAQGNSITNRLLKEGMDDAKPADMLKTVSHAAMGHWNALMQSLAQKAAPLGGMTPEVASEMLKILASPVSPAVRAGQAVNGGARSSASMLPYSWGAKNRAAGLPSIQAALERRAAAEARAGRWANGMTRGGVGILEN